MDTLLINPNSIISAPMAAIEPPIYAGMIAGDLISKGKDVVILDAEADNLSFEETVYRVLNLNPDEIIINVMGNNPSVSSTPKMPVAERLLTYFPEARLVGIHPIAVNHPKAMKPVNGTPKIPWQLYDLNKYKAHNWHCIQDIDNRIPYGVLYTSTGCPFRCFYCNIHTLYGDRKIRYRPLRDIYCDLDYFAEHGIKNIKIWDELFCLDPIRVYQICDYVIYREYYFNFWAYARVDTVNYWMLERMKRAGINWLAYGFESADTSVRDINHKGYKENKPRLAIDMTREAGINIIGNYIFGLPGDTLESMQANHDMACRENFEYINYYVALPYPGSDWYESLENKPTDWSNFSQYSKSMLGNPEVIKFKDKCFREYFNRPEYLKMVKDKFGDKAVNHIQEMLKWNIR